jgi:peptidoglycan/LPS O-acetylase OafA/YrhL
MSARRYAPLDGLRGVAAISILLLHLERPGFHMPPATYTAVDLFFLISGFVIAEAYEARISKFGVLAFVRARLIRLYPMLLVGLLILPAYCAVVFARHGTWPATPWELLGSLGASVMLMPSHLPPSKLWDDALLFPLNGPVWSLMLEMFVNLAYALLLPWLSRRALAFIVLTSGSLLVLAQLRLDGIDLGWGWPSALGGFPRATFSFFLGVLIFRLRIPRPAMPPVMVLAAAPLLFYAPPLFAVMVGFPLVLIAATSTHARGSRFMTAMGALSYPIYVIHFPLLHWIGWLLAGRMPAWASIPVSVALVLLCAILALKLWDEPLRRWLLRQRSPTWAAKAATP